MKRRNLFGLLFAPLLLKVRPEKKVEVFPNDYGPMQPYWRTRSEVVNRSYDSQYQGDGWWRSYRTGTTIRVKTPPRFEE